MQNKGVLRGRIVIAVATLLVALFAITTATFAWYIYNTSAHTTTMHMAAGSSTTLQINDRYAESEGHMYGTNTSLLSMTGSLNPVSTNRVLNGFHKVYGFTNGTDTQGRLQANLFGSVDTFDYYKTSLYFRTLSETPLDLYLNNISYVDGNSVDPLSTAIRVGFVVYPAGNDGVSTDACTEFIFALNQDKNIHAPEYNTYTGGSEVGEWALDSSQFDNTTFTVQEIPVVEMKPYGEGGDNILYTADNYFEGEKPVLLSTVGPTDTPVRVDVYLWLEGCDKDCTRDLMGGNLNSIALEFNGIDHA